MRRFHRGLPHRFGRRFPEGFLIVLGALALVVLVLIAAGLAT